MNKQTILGFLTRCSNPRWVVWFLRTLSASVLGVSACGGRPHLSQCQRSASNRRLPSARRAAGAVIQHSDRQRPACADPSLRWSLHLQPMKSSVMNIISLPAGAAAWLVLFSSLCCGSQTDRAVQLLLETSADNPSYYCDSLKACLVTTITSSGPSQSTIKLVATNMIANGKLAGSSTDQQQLFCLFTECLQLKKLQWGRQTSNKSAEIS